MSENEQNNFIKYFNAGYLISMHLPDLSDKLKDAFQNSPRGEAFQAGREQFIIDKREARKQKFHTASKNVSKQQEHIKSNDRDIDIQRD